MKKTILMQVFDPDEKSVTGTMISEAEAIRHIDMHDCWPASLECHYYDVSEFGQVKPLNVYGTWHCPDDPLFIELKDESGNTVYAGYGTDH